VPLWTLAHKVGDEAGMMHKTDVSVAIYLECGGGEYIDFLLLITVCYIMLSKIAEVFIPGASF
jgi:hypothetical protein